MPVFSYLSEDEAADAYLYLTLYPPGTMPAAAAGTVQPDPPVGPALGSNTHVRLADDPANPGTVSLAQLAVFPGVIFLFLGAVALKGMPRIAAHALRGQANSQAAPARISMRQSEESGESRGRGELLGEVSAQDMVLRANCVLKPALWLMATAMFLLFPSQPCRAIPAFARMYGTSCSTCHIDFPKLNDFGKAFKDAGFKFPKDDESMLKIPPVMLGAPANAELWPKAIWPGTIPGQPPIGLRYNNYFQYTSSNRNQYSALVPAGTVPPFIPATDFQTGFFSIFTAGNFGSDIAFWVDDDISVSGANANGGLGEAYLKFVNIGRMIKLPPHVLNLRIGQVELDIPFTQSKSIWVSPYDIYLQSSIGVVNPAFNQQFVNNAMSVAGSGKGIEFSGGLHTGGYNYSIAFINQNTSGTAQANNNSYVPTATGSNFGGVGIASDANFKDIYTSFNYRFNLEKDKESRNSIQAAGPSGPRDHTYLNFGTYLLYGRSLQR
jgi:hypothetical protein